MLLKCTAIASAISVMDIMGVAHEIIAHNYLTIADLSLAGLIYLILSFFIAVPLKKIYLHYMEKFKFQLA